MSAALVLCFIALMLLLNALYVAAEFALVVANSQKFHAAAKSGDALAKQVVEILDNRRSQDRYIATAQLGITLASLGLGMYGEHKISTWIYDAIAFRGLPAWLASHAIASALAVMILTYLHIVLGEMAPKSIALTAPDRSARALFAFMRVSELVARPLVSVLSGMGNVLLRSLRLSNASEALERNRTPEEIQYLVRESGQSGLITPEAAEVIEDLIEFGHLTAGEVMLPRVRIQGIELASNAEGLRKTVGDSPHTRYPVYVGDLDHIIGTIHIKTVLRRVLEGTAMKQQDISPVPFVPKTSTLNKVLSALKAQRSQMVVVMDEHGGTSGIISLADLFEEIVGDIEEDVGAGKPPEIGEGRDGVWLLRGTARLDEVAARVGRSFARDDVDTVSGLVLALLDRPPQPGDVVESNGMRLDVTRVEGHGVEECRLLMLRDGLEQISSPAQSVQPPPD